MDIEVKKEVYYYYNIKISYSDVEKIIDHIKQLRSLDVNPQLASVADMLEEIFGE